MTTIPFWWKKVKPTNSNVMDERLKLDCKNPFRNVSCDFVRQPPTNEFVGLPQANAPVKQAQADQPQ